MDNLKELREKKKMTQIEVAKKIGVCLAAYRLWEAGGGKPNEENYQKLLKLFDILPFAEE
jgi:transcriptional regulator with XRE-family HTH domain